MLKMEQILINGAKEVMRKTLSKKLDIALEQGKKFAEKVAPEDTGDYVSGFETKKAELRGTEIVGEIRNNDQKATGVERGRRKSPVNWSKQGGSPIVEYGVGARVFQKTGEFIKNQFIRNVQQG